MSNPSFIDGLAFHFNRFITCRVFGFYASINMYKSNEALIIACVLNVSYCSRIIQAYRSKEKLKYYPYAPNQMTNLRDVHKGL